MKGRSGKEWYEIQIQTDGGLQRTAGFNTDKYKNVNRFHKIGQKISVDVKYRMDRER